MSNGIGSDITVETDESKRETGRKIKFRGDTGITPNGVQAGDIVQKKFYWYFMEEPAASLSTNDLEQLVKTGEATKRTAVVNMQSDPKTSEDSQTHVWTKDQLSNDQSTDFIVVLYVELVVATGTRLYQNNVYMETKTYPGWNAKQVTIKPAPPTAVPSDDGVKTAYRLHKEFTTNLKNWKKFQVGGFDTQTEKEDTAVARKIRLWSVISKTIDEARRDQNFDAADIHQALGIDSGSYSSDYYEGHVKAPNSASIADILGFGEYATDHVGTAALNATEKNISDDPCTFVEFGRKLFAYRSGTVNSAKRLVSYLLQGTRNGEDWQGKPTLHENPFLQDFKRKSYIEQVEIFHDLTEGLAQSEVGKQFLGGLFANRGRSAAIDPFDLFYPPVVSPADKKKLNPSDPIVAIVSSDTRKKFFTPKYGTLATNNNKLTPHATAFAKYFYGLSMQLKAGAQFYLKKCNDEVYPDERATAETVVGKFQTRVLMTVFEKSDIETMISDQATLTKLEAIGTDVDVDSVSWDWSADTVAFVKHAIDHFDKWATNSSFDQTAIGDRPRLLYEVKVGLIVWSFGAAVYEVSTKSAQNELKPADVGALGLTLTKVVADSADVLKDYGVQFAETFVDTTFGRLLTKVISPIVDVIFIISDATRVSKQWREHDYDAALVIGASVAVSFLIVGLEIAAGSSMFGGVPGVLIAIGAVVGAAMLALEKAFDDPAIAGILKVSVFGTMWADMESYGLFDITKVEYDDVTAQEFDFVHNRSATRNDQLEPNYGRQITKIHTTFNKLGLAQPQLTSDATTSRYVLSVDLNPPQQSTIMETGALYLRPYFHGEFGPYLQKLALDDEVAQRGSSDWNSGFPYLDSEWLGLKTQNMHAYRAAMKGYWTGYASHAPDRERFTESVVTHGINTGQFDGVDTVSLNPKTSNSPDVTQRLRTQDNSWADEIAAVRLTIETKFPPLLLGIRPYNKRNILKWPDDTALEVTYVPPELESHIQSGDAFVNNDLDLEQFPALSREIKPVSSNVTLIQGTDRHQWEAR